MLVPIADIRQAAKRIERYLKPTPLLFSRHFSESTGCQVYLKMESMQPTHSFKVRGAFNAVLCLSEDRRRRGIITASGGNHGLGVALACNTLQIPCTIVLPISTPPNKIAAIANLAANIILHGQSWDEANIEAIRHAQIEDKTYIHAFDDPKVMAGQGTIVLELLNQMDPPDLIIASIGGGGLISGIISAARQLLPQTRIIGSETDGANCMSASLNAGHIVELPAITSICDSLGARKTTEHQFAIVSKHVSKLVVVSDAQAISSLLELLKEEKLLVEPASSCALAVLTSGKIDIQKGERIVVIMCGANIALDKVCLWQEQQSQLAMQNAEII